MTQKDTSTTNILAIVFPTMPALPDPRDLYDSLMNAIEPELVSYVLPTLAEKYKSESPSEAEARAKRYSAAFEKFDTAMRAYMEKLNQSIREYGRKAAASIEGIERSEEARVMNDMDSQINNS